MTSLIVSPAADADTDEILLYLRRTYGDKVANDYDKKFDTLYNSLHDWPESRSLRPGLGQGIRAGFINPYTIIHRYDSATDTVTILRIIHSKRKITPKLTRE